MGKSSSHHFSVVSFFLSCPRGGGHVGSSRQPGLVGEVPGRREVGDAANAAAAATAAGAEAAAGEAAQGKPERQVGSARGRVLSARTLRQTPGRSCSRRHSARCR